jgi:hypothetical protein
MEFGLLSSSCVLGVGVAGLHAGVEHTEDVVTHLGQVRRGRGRVTDWLCPAGCCLRDVRVSDGWTAEGPTFPEGVGLFFGVLVSTP